MFYDSRTRSGIHSQVTELRRFYNSCLAYQQYIGDASDGVLQSAAYDRNLSESHLLKLISRRIALLRSRGEPLEKLTARAYLKWTYDDKGGLFALMRRQ